jgi:DNA-binding transcriptional regulator GbsR (MarR family)
MACRNINLQRFKKLDSNSDKVLSLLKNYPSLSVDSISAILNLSKSRTCLVMNSLKKFKMVDSYHRKTSYWKLKKK